MCRIRALGAVFVIGTFASSCVAKNRLPTLRSSPEKNALQERIQTANEEVRAFKLGHVIVGQVVVDAGDDPTLVTSQMLILNGGYFAGATRDLTRPVGFRMHGYAPYDVELKGKTGDIVDVGVIKMRRLSPTGLVPLAGQLVLEGTSNPSQATVSLSVAGGPVNTPSNGTEPRPKWAKPIQVTIDSSGSLHADGFSPISYYASITASGYVSQGLPVDVRPGVGADLGTIALERPRRIVLEYVASKEGPFDIKASKKTVLAGGGRWKATPDIYGWDLEFAQKNGEFFFEYSYAPCFIADLGTSELRDFLNIDEATAKDVPQNMAVKDGHLYLLNQRHWKRNILFKVTVQRPE